MLGNETITLPDGSKLSYYPNFLTPSQASKLYSQLLEYPCWQQHSIKLFGRVILEPRLSDFVGDKNTKYRYSKQDRHAAAWPQSLQAYRFQVEEFSGQKFNCALLNLYRDGNDSMGWHADNEPELGKKPAIASLSLGAERRFSLRPNSNNTHSKTIRLTLAHGSLLVMHPGVQEAWQHSVAKTSPYTNTRINVTFRRII